MEFQFKEVDFHKYCNKCKHKDKKEYEDPCYDCLCETVNTYSKKPVYFKENKEKTNGKTKSKL